MTTTIRPYEPGDLADLHDICIRTGLAGGDATGHLRDPDILPVLFAAPYAEFDPGLVFVADNGKRVIGYIVGAADSTAYYARLRDRWLPRYAERFPAPAGPPGDLDELFADLLHRSEQMLIPEIAADYPAHLHIDLLPEGQRQGLGRRLMNAYVDALRQRGVPGVHLTMSVENTNARAFYDRVGFAPLAVPKERENDSVVVLGQRLD